MIIELHRKVQNNVGDLFSNPSRYFDFANCSSQELMHNKSALENQILVVGGGGLIHKKFQLHIQEQIAKSPAKVVLWGIGHNFGKKHISKSSDRVYFPDWINKCDSVGIRDYVQDYEKYYLPCVSCMHTAFDKKYTTTCEVGYFLHKFKTKIKNTDNKSIMFNDSIDFDKTIQFIASHNTIITDSYHGAYWAQLLGKNVQVVGWSVKFNHFKNPPLFLDNINQTPSSSTNKISYDFLTECRKLNQDFYHKFLDTIS
jgi:exopolysaccharide biosynthesis predicted pyruvyltransferase EpsI